MQTAPVAVAIQAVSKTFSAGSVRALDAVSLDIRENEFFTLLGPSGCGKTTLLRLIAGFDHPDAGAILLGGDDISALPPYRRPVNTVFQSYALFPHMSVADNVAFGLQMLGKPRAEVDDAVSRMLALVQLDELSKRRSSELSGGQQQRVALARALAPRPRVLLLDEPLSALDLKLRKNMQRELKRLQHETGITFIFVTHDQEEALTMSDRIAVMNAGQVLQIGTPREVYDRPSRRFVADFIGDSNLLNATEAGGRLRFDNGSEIAPPASADLLAGGRISVAVRPEHAVLNSADSATSTFTGMLEDAVFFGTDTHYHVALDHGETFVVRAQNRRDDAPAPAIGDRVGVSLLPGAVQVLRD